MGYLDDLREIQSKIKKGIQNEIIFDEIVRRCSLEHKTPVERYKALTDVLAARDAIHNEIKSAGLKEDVSLTGTITERICKIGLEAGAPDKHSKLPKDWKWVGDFMIIGKPYNIFVSVKSYSARERLIASGTGQQAAPVIGYGLFDKKSEWSIGRVRQYLQRGFVAIYMPNKLLSKLSTESKNIKNAYNRPFLRDISAFSDDLIAGYNKGKDDKFLELDKF